MSEITTTQIGTNRYAPAGADEVRLFNHNGAEGMTLGQMVISVCIARAAVIETTSVARMNKMTSTNAILDKLANYAQQVVDGTATWSMVKNFLVQTCGVSSDLLPDEVSTVPNRLKAFSVLRQQMDNYNNVSQRDMVDLQSLVNRRDVAFSTSTNTVRSILKTGTGTASNL
jgi:hypothetical protein